MSATDGEVRVDGWLVVSWLAAEVVDCLLPESAVLPSVSQRLDLALRSSNSELLGAVSAVIDHSALGQGPIGRRASPLLKELYAATARLDATAAVQVIASLLGLGPGLTPGGDDLLVGWIAGTAVGGLRAVEMLRSVGPQLIEMATVRTGWLSQAFLAAALSGCVADAVRKFVIEPDDANLKRLLSLGSTSGADLLGGYLLARDALARSSSRR